MKKKSKGSKQTLIFMIILGILLMGAYYFISNSKKNSNDTESDYEILMNKNIEASYPATSREVVKLYSRFTKCLYSEKLSDDQIAKMAEKIRILYDKELLNNNPVEDYVYDLKLDIADYRTDKRVISSYKIDSADNVVTWTDNDMEFAKIYVTFTVKDSEKSNKTVEEFLLRKNESKQWKIVGFRVVNNTNNNDTK